MGIYQYLKCLAHIFQYLKCLAQGIILKLWGSYPGPLALKSKALPLSHRRDPVELHCFYIDIGCT